MTALRVCALYPDTMNLYADRGNLLVLEQRCARRGIGFQLEPAGIGDRIDADDHDLFYLGGGQDADQRRCAHDLVEVKRGALLSAAERGAVLLGICGGYQLFGRFYAIGDETLPGLGLLDVHTVREAGPRLVGNVTIEVECLPGETRLARGFREPCRTHLPWPTSRSSRTGGARSRQQRRGRDGGSTPGQRHRHLSARPPSAQERVVRRLADRKGPGDGRARSPARQSGGEGPRAGVLARPHLLTQRGSTDAGGNAEDEDTASVHRSATG